MPAGSGRIGLMACPGGARGFGGGSVDRLEIDLRAIAASGASGIVTLIERAEFAMLGVEAMPALAAVCATRSRTPNGTTSERAQSGGAAA